MASLSEALHADAARTAYQSSLTIARAAWAACHGMQWRTAAQLFEQAAATLLPDPHFGVHSDAHLYRVRAHICRTMIPCAVPLRALPEAVEHHRWLREGDAS
jgi:hypothetical protein